MNRVMNICLVLLLLVMLPGVAVASSVSLGTAGQYNTFIFNDFSGSSDTEGRLAVGGDAFLDGYSVGAKITTGGDVMVVGGSFSMTSGNVYNGDARVGSTNSVPGYDFTPQGDYFVGGPSPINFAKEESYLKTLSTNLSQQVANGIAELKYGNNMFLTGDGASALQVFQLDGADLLNSGVLWLNNVAQDATLLLNVSGSLAGLTNMNLIELASIREKVLFNFYETDILQLAGVGVQGSILAPFADVLNPQGVIHGTIIASSFAGHMQQNHQPFTGELPGSPTPVPESGTLILLGLGLLGVYGASRRKSAKQ